MKHLPIKLQALARGERESFDEMNLLETEKRLIIRALTNTEWNQSKAAEVLGISRKQLRMKMKNFGLLRDPDPGKGVSGSGFSINIWRRPRAWYIMLNFEVL